MADEKDGAQVTQQKKSPLKLIIIGLVIMAIIPIIGFFVASKFLMSDTEKKEETPATETMGEVFPIETIVVNIANTHATRYLRAGVTLETSDKKAIKELELRLSQITDILIMILSNKELDDLIDSAGKNQIRREILDKVNAKLTDGKITNVYFTEFVIQ